MAVTFSTLFTRLGALFDMAAKVRTHQALLRTELADVVGHFSAADMHRCRVLLDRFEDRVREAGNIVQDLRAVAQAELIDAVDDDLISSTGGGLETRTVHEALKQLAAQMDTASSTLDRTTISLASVAATSGNTGSGTLLVYDKCPIVNNPDNDQQMSARTELITATCTTDSNDSNVAEGSEVFNISGQGEVDRLAEDWPKGTGDVVNIEVATPRVDAGTSPGLNVLTNSDFESFSTNPPSNFTIVTGSAGTNVYEESSTVFTQDKSMKITCSGTAVKLKQNIGVSSGGTAGLMFPDRPYSFSVALRLAANASAGSITFSVKDSGGTILNNLVSGRTCSTTVAESAISHTGWTHVTGTWFTPIAVPKGCFFEINCSSAFDQNLFIDDIVLAEMPRLGPGGVAVQMIGGATNFAYNDSFTCQVTNNNEGDLVREMDRFFDTKSHGIQLPTHASGSETIADSLIA